MLSTKTRSFIIGLAVSATGLTGIASAGARPVTGVQRPVAPVSRAVALTGHTTGAPGAASEEACQAIGEEANAQYLLASLNLADGNLPAAKEHGAAGTAVENAGLSAGCFFIE